MKTPFWPSYLRRRQNFEKTGQKLRFFGARSPLKLVYIGAKGVFRKNLGPPPKMVISNSTKGGPFKLAGGRIPEERGVPPPKSARWWSYLLIFQKSQIKNEPLLPHPCDLVACIFERIKTKTIGLTLMLILFWASLTCLKLLEIMNSGHRFFFSSMTPGAFFPSILSWQLKYLLKPKLFSLSILNRL